MPNTFVTPMAIARKALLTFMSKLVAVALVNRSLTSSFAKKGNVINAQVPALFKAEIFDRATGIKIQDATERSVPVVVDRIADTSFEINAEDLALSVEDFNEQLIVPAINSILEQIDTDIYNTVYPEVANHIGTAGTTPSTIQDIQAIRTKLNKLKVPMQDRVGIWDPDADGKLSIIDSIMHAEKSGSTDALKEGSIGRVQGLDNFMTQNLPYHNAGTYTALTDVKATGTKDALTVSLTSATGTTESLVKGDLLTIGGSQYAVAADTAEAASGALTVTLTAPLQDDLSAADVTFAGSHQVNLAWNKGAIAFVNPPLQPPKDKEAYTVNKDGLSIRVVIGYDMEKKVTVCSLDCLYGIKLLHPNAVVRVLG